MRIQTLYEVGEFERSFIEAHQGNRLHRHLFGNGIHRAMETVDNFIGQNTTDNMLAKLLPWIKGLEDKREKLMTTFVPEFQGI